MKLISTINAFARGALVAAGLALGLGAAATDHDARTGGVNVDADLVAGALDLDTADSSRLELGHQRTTDLPVLGEVVLVLALAEPAALPVGGDTQPEAVRIDLLTQ